IEINISDLIKWLRKENVTLLVPFMVGKSFRLVKYRLPLKIKKFSVKEPNNSIKIYKKIDLAIVPVIGIDKTFRRIGFGKGFYDRFFGEKSIEIKEIVFIGREICISDKNITDDYDVEGDIYLASDKVFIKDSSKNSVRKKSRR
ncbi:MAG: 5-formyltetrahydrofolate cyclo-ligase, partial [Sulfurovaceae bacterium]|nr:5-formyltetrahydrofolate cyclo-ligase [Sulfurovaceae bacterium]